MAVQGGSNFQGISSMLIERMTDIRDTYQAERKKRIEREKAVSPESPASPGYRYSFKSGQIGYHSSKRK